jgi:hypothetical protein
MVVRINLTNILLSSGVSYLTNGIRHSQFDQAAGARVCQNQYSLNLPYIILITTKRQMNSRKQSPQPYHPC